MLGISLTSSKSASDALPSPWTVFSSICLFSVMFVWGFLVCESRFLPNVVLVRPGIWILTPVEFGLQPMEFESNARGNVSKLAGTFQTELKLPIFLEFPSYVQFMQWNSLTFSASSLFLTKISCFPSFLPLEDSEQPRKAQQSDFLKPGLLTN